MPRTLTIEKWTSKPKPHTAYPVFGAGGSMWTTGKDGRGPPGHRWSKNVQAFVPSKRKR